MGDQFTEGLVKFNAIAEKKATRLLRRVSMKALELVVTGTPVLTGCCRGNWIVSFGNLSKSFDANKKDAGGGETIKAGMARIESATLGIDVLIENSCPYVLRLENGWSRQKPPGSMVRTPAARLKAALEKGAR